MPDAPGVPVPGRIMHRLAPAADVSVEQDLFTFVFSDESVARDGHVVINKGIETGAFMANPVIPWAHDTSEPPIARATAIKIGPPGGASTVTVEFVPREISAFAAMIRDMVAGKWLRACSMGWNPIDWKYSTDRSRPGGIDFLRSDLMEISIVPVPALPTALEQARAGGIDTGPLYTWAEKVLDGGGMILVPRAELENLRRIAKMPTASRQPAVVTAAAPAAPITRGLYAVGSLADLLSYLGYLQQDAAWEASFEEDGSAVPGMLADACKNLGEILVAMTVEEVGELLASMQDEGEAEDAEVFLAAAKTPAQRALRGLVLAGRAVKRRAAPAAETVTLRLGAEITDEIRALLTEATAQRAGKVLSAANEKTLRDAHEAMTGACDMVRGVFEQNGEEAARDEEAAAAAEEEARAASQAAGTDRGRRTRLAKALKLQAEHGAA